MSSNERARRLAEAASSVHRNELPAFERLVALGESMCLGSAESVSADVARELRSSLQAQPPSAEALRDARYELGELLERPSVVLGDPDADSSRRVLELLRLRARHEHARFACESMGLGEAWALDLEDACIEFDDALAPSLHRLVPFNSVRGLEIALVEPTLRQRFPFWRAGAGLRSDVLAMLPDVAALCVRFPEAADELLALEVVERRLRDGGDAAGRPGSLGRWIAAKSKHAAASGTLRMAAAGVVPRDSLVRTPTCEISWMPPSLLVVDVLEPLREGLLPTMALPGGTIIPAGPVEGALDRYAFEIGTEVLDAMRVTVRVPMRDHTEEIGLPRD